MTFIDELTGQAKESVVGSKIKSEGSLNPCVLKIEVCLIHSLRSAVMKMALLEYVDILQISDVLCVNVTSAFVAILRFFHALASMS